MSPQFKRLPAITSMSDEDEYLSEDSYEFEFEDDEDADVSSKISFSHDTSEHQYYYAKGLKDESLHSAIETFGRLVSTATSDEDAEWIFKSYKQLAKISYYQLRYQDTLRYISQLIGLLPKLNGNYAEDSINKLLIRYMSSANRSFVSEMYNIIVSRLQDSMVSGTSGQRLWLRININRFSNLLEDSNTKAAGELLNLIKEQMGKVSELTRNSFALDVIAAEIEFSMRVGSSVADLAQFHSRSARVSSSITHPRVMGVIWECGATVHFYRGQFEKARLEFYESFKNYDEAGSSSKQKILKYLGLCSMLTDNEVNPFESQETQTYAQLQEYWNLNSLLSAYENRRLDDFYAILAQMKATNDLLLQDRLFQMAEKRVLHNLKLKVLSNYFRASKSIRFDYLVRKLGLEGSEDLENLIMFMANNGFVSNVSINYIDQIVDVDEAKPYSVFPSCADGSSMKNNLAVLHELDYGGPWRPPSIVAAEGPTEADPMIYANMSSSVFVLGSRSVLKNVSNLNVYELLFCEASTQVNDRTDPQEWYDYMSAAIPKRRGLALNQREKINNIMSEHYEKSSKHESEEEEFGHIKTGILGSSINFEESPDIAEQKPETNKLDLLMDLTRSMKKKLNA